MKRAKNQKSITALVKLNKTLSKILDISVKKVLT